MTKQRNHQEAIARIMAVAKQVAEREAAKEQEAIDSREKRKAAAKARRLADPEKWREQKRKKTAVRDERRRQRAKIDPVYADKLRQQRRDQYLRRKEREGAAKLCQKTKESIARRIELDPSGFKQKQREYNRRNKERQKERMASDPVYAAEVRAKRRAYNKAKKKRLLAELHELRALKASLQANLPESPESSRQ